MIHEILLFVSAVFVGFYFPGSYLSAKLKFKLPFFDGLFVNSVLGLLVFTFIAYLLSWLKLTTLLLPVLLIVSVLTIKNKYYLFNKFQKKYLLHLSYILLCTIIFSLPLLLSGVYGDMIKYGRDDLWHLALINELKVNFPPDHPGFAGVSLKGYHFFFDYLLAQISNTFFISPLSLYFHFIPLLISFLWAFGVFVFMSNWTKRISSGYWAVFLSMFGGSFGYFIQLQGHWGFDILSGMGIGQPSSSILNPPYSISIIILIFVLFAILKFFESKKRTWLMPIILGTGLITMFKVYAGIILICGLIFLSLIEIFKRRFELIISLGITSLIFFLTYWIFRDPTSTLIYYPFWAPHSVLIDNFPWYGYTEKFYTYSKKSVIRGLIEIESYAFGIFIIGNLGTRFIGLLIAIFLYFRKHIIHSVFSLSLIVMMTISFLIPLLFIQSGKVFEIIQMAWYFLFFASLFASVGFSFLFDFKKHKIFKIILFIIIIIMTIPSTITSLHGVFSYAQLKGESLSSPFYRSMSFLRRQGNYNQTILEIPPPGYQTDEKNIRRWYKDSTPAIIAFSNKKSFLNYEYIDFYGIDIKPRILFLKKVLNYKNSATPSMAREIEKDLIEYKISYINSPYLLNSFELIHNLKEIYRDENNIIYKVERIK